MTAFADWTWDDDERGVRHLAFRGVAIARAVSAVLRDENWDTPAVHDLARTSAEDGEGILLTLTGRLADDAPGMTFALALRLARDGRATIGFRGAFEGAIRYNRAGICLCLPPEFAGARYDGGAGDRAIAGALPERIGPQLLVDGKLRGVIPPFDRLDMRRAGLELDTAFTGDVFEMEDQRNWSDASFKIYSTPLATDWPFTAAAGQVVEQSVGLAVRVDASAAALPPARFERVVLPSIGLQTPADAPLAAPADAVRALAPDHLRVDVDVPGPLDLAVARVAAAATHAPVELAVRVTGEPAAELAELRRALDERAIAVARLLVVRPGEKTVDARAVDLVRAAFDGVAPVGGGSDAYFAEVNRGPLDPAALDAVSFSISPQVHDPASTPVLETLPMQAEIVRSAREAFGLPVVLSTVTLRPRFNPNATEPGGQALGGPDSVDPRQGTEFAAAWMLGAVAECAAEGAASLTLYEVDGPRGVLSADGAPLAAPEARALLALRGLGREVLVLRDAARGAYVLASAERGRAIVVNRSRHPLGVAAAGWSPDRSDLVEGTWALLRRAAGDAPLDDAEVADWF